MESLNLYVKDGIRVNLDAVVLKNILGKTLFVLVFDIHEFLKSFLVICINLQFFQFCKIGDPSVSDVIGNPVCQKLISVKQETSLGNTICLIVEFLRIHFIEVSERFLLKNFCMKSCNTVYRVSAGDCKVSHLNLSVINDSHLLNLLIISREFSLDIKNKATVDFFYDLVDTRKQFGEQVDRPFLKCFCHNCMVCISTCVSCDIPCIRPFQTFFVYKDTHKLCNCQCWMCIVHLESNFLWKIMDIAVIFLEFFNCCLKACRYKEVLLFQTKFFSCTRIIIRIKNVYKVFCKVFLLNSLLVFTLVKQIQVELYNRFGIPDS